VSIDKPLGMSAHHYTLEDLEAYPQHQYELKSKALVEVKIDHKQMGVGGDNSWGHRPHEKYRLLEDQYNYSFSIVPMMPNESTTNKKR
jgi:beta-galactosidase